MNCAETARSEANDRPASVIMLAGFMSDHRWKVEEVERMGPEYERGSDGGQKEAMAWVRRLAEGDDSAAEFLWERYSRQLVQLARQKLMTTPRRAFDEEDVALSAMNSFIVRALRNEFPDLNDDDNLWRLLVTITSGKVRERQRREMALKRGGGTVRGDSVCGELPLQDAGRGLDQFAEDSPTPEAVAEFTESVEAMLAALEDDQLTELARFKLEGYTNEEIATLINRSVATVERRLKRIREKWNRASGEDVSE